MQEVVNAVNLSPPVMAFSKPAANAVKPPDQENFELVLKKVSERKSVNKRADRVLEKTEFESKKQIDSQTASTNNIAIVDPKNEAAPKKDEREKEISESNEVTVNNTLSQTGGVGEITGDVPLASNPILNGKVLPAAQPELETLMDASRVAITENGAAAEDIQPKSNLNMLKSLTETFGAVTSQPEVISDAGAKIVAATDQLVSKTDQVLASDKGIKVDPKDVTVGALQASQSQQDNQQSARLPATRLSGEVLQSSQADAKSSSEPNIKTKTKLESSIQISADSAPPESPGLVEGAKMYSTIKNTQISEPARLAEAPKNEMIAQVADQLDGMLKTNKSSLRMQLYPEELGHIDLRIVSNRGGVGVTLIADKASTQQILQSEMNSLRQTIEQAGIQLNNLNIGHDQTSNKQQFEGRQNASQQNQEYKPDVKGQAKVSGEVTKVSLEDPKSITKSKKEVLNEC